MNQFRSSSRRRSERSVCCTRSTSLRIETTMSRRLPHPSSACCMAASSHRVPAVSVSTPRRSRLRSRQMLRWPDCPSPRILSSRSSYARHWQHSSGAWVGLAPWTCSTSSWAVGRWPSSTSWLDLLRRNRPWLVVTCHDVPSLVGATMLFRALDRRGLRRIGWWASQSVGRALERRVMKGLDTVLTLTRSGERVLGQEHGRPAHFSWACRLRRGCPGQGARGVPPRLRGSRMSDRRCLPHRLSGAAHAARSLEGGRRRS